MQFILYVMFIETVQVVIQGRGIDKKVTLFDDTTVSWYSRGVKYTCSIKALYFSEFRVCFELKPSSD